MNLAENVNIDVQSMLTGRGCIIGQSGSGKSFLAGVITEELCKLDMPFCIIDTEGEYKSLKSLHNLIVVGEDGDVGTNIDFLKLFNTSIENNIPVVMDVSEVMDGRALVYKALEALYLIENRLRKPYLVILEEADKFAPQLVSKSINVIEEISVRGRKRGIGLLVATQRPANISKNVLSQCSYGFIGKLTIENDLNAIRVLFEDRNKLVAITRLGMGEFTTFGIGIGETFKVKKRTVKHMGMTPTINNRKHASARFVSLIKELKSTQKPKAHIRTNPKTIEIDALRLSLSEGNARAYAAKVARKRFGLFGNITEKIDSVTLQYLPIAECTFRIPTRKRNEYLEYPIRVYDRHNAIEINKRVRFFDASTLYGKYKGYSKNGNLEIQDAKTQKENILEAKIDRKGASECLKKAFPEAFLTEFHIVHLPIYRITLKKGNKVRVFRIDGIYGKEIEPPK